MAIGPKLRWIKSDIQNKIYLFSFLIISFFLSYMIIKNLNIDFLINSILITSSFYLFFITLRDFFIKGYQNLSQNLAHFGFSLLILSILLNNIFSNEIITNLKVGEKFNNDKFQIKFVDLKQSKEKNYISFRGYFLIKEDGIEDKLEPELRVYDQPNIITSEADIKTSFLKDKFITINTVQNEEYFNIRYQVKPLMVWIWISVLLISLGGTMSLFKKRNL